MLYFAAYTDACGMAVDGGVMITGSHNPPDYTGFKLVLHKASVFGPEIQELGRMAAAADYENGHGRIEEVLGFDAYVDSLPAEGREEERGVGKECDRKCR